MKTLVKILTILVWSIVYWLIITLIPLEKAGGLAQDMCIIVVMFVLVPWTQYVDKRQWKPFTFKIK